MDILLETTWGEYKRERKSYWIELEHGLGWIGCAFVLILALIIASFYLESSITFPKPGETKIVVGGPVSWLGLSGAVVLISVFVWKSRQLIRTATQSVADDEILFLRFSDVGVEYGTRGTAAKYYSWLLVTRVDFKLGSMVLELPQADLVVNSDRLTPEGIAALKAFFAKERERIPTEMSVGRWGDAGKEAFGAKKRIAVK